MCGIIAYNGKKQAPPILIDGLRRLEYRGYDSAGIAVENDNGFNILKKAGRIDCLAEVMAGAEPSGTCGISHTRWATHGAPTDANAHPHASENSDLVLVHNGVIENYRPLRETLALLGHTFASETDTEVLAHLVSHHYQQLKASSMSMLDNPLALTDEDALERLLAALRLALSEVKGTYGIAFMHRDVPGVVIGARLGSPLVVGLARDGHFLASDVSAMVAHTQEAVYLNDYDIVVMRPDRFDVQTREGLPSRFEVSHVEFSQEQTDKNGFPHFMLKEIFEQPESLANSLRGRLSRDDGTAVLGGLQMTPKDLRNVDRMLLSGCGSAYHAGLAGECIIESLARIPVEVEIASEFRYRNIPTGKNTLQLVISQSGETIDTLAALREGQRKGLRVLGVVNTVASTIARASDGGVYMHCGPEIGVAATKTFTSQLGILTLIGLLLGRIHHLSSAEGMALVDELEELPGKIRRVLEQSGRIKAIARKYADAAGMLFLGRQAHYPVALEGALKMKEISYLNASGHPTAELKHGIIALIGPSFPSLFIAPQDAVLEKNISSIEEVRARRGPVIALTTEGAESRLAHLAEDIITIPECSPVIAPLLSVIPLQLLSYHLAVARDCDVDKPRNLAKSVTVE